MVDIIVGTRHMRQHPLNKGGSIQRKKVYTTNLASKNWSKNRLHTSELPICRVWSWSWCKLWTEIWKCLFTTKKRAEIDGGNKRVINSWEQTCQLSKVLPNIPFLAFSFSYYVKITCKGLELIRIYTPTVSAKSIFSAILIWCLC